MNGDQLEVGNGAQEGSFSVQIYFSFYWNDAVDLSPNFKDARSEL